MFFVNTMKINDKISIVNNPHVPHRIQATVVSIDKENETARVQYEIDGIQKTRNVEFSQICPSKEHFATEMAKCLETLIKF